eukprot:SAG31_NODE_819_length_11811_cov_3.315488_13_plen_70_part_00
MPAAKRIKDPSQYVGAFVRKKFKGFEGWFDGQVKSFEYACSTVLLRSFYFGHALLPCSPCGTPIACRAS